MTRRTVLGVVPQSAAAARRLPSSWYADRMGGSAERRGGSQAAELVVRGQDVRLVPR